MMKPSEPNPFAVARRETHPRQLIAELNLVIHPAERSIRICRTGRADRLAHQIHIVDQGSIRMQAFRNRRANEGMIEGFNGLPRCQHRRVVTGIQAPTHTVVGEACQAPRACNGFIFRQRMGCVIQIGQIFDAAEDAHHELNDLGLRCMGAGLLMNGEHHHLFQQTVLLQNSPSATSKP
jgi:hypothetical protein